MQPCGGCWAARRLLPASPAPPPAAGQSIDAQRAHLERVLGATTTVLFLASVSYIALTTLYGCLRAAQPPADDDHHQAPGPPRAEDTKRTLQGIPVRRVVVPSKDEADADDCAVCLAEYAAGDEVRVLPACRHGFHRECVDRWLLARAPTCPVCRAPLVAAHDEADADADAKEECATGDTGVDVVSRAIPAA